MRVVSVGFQQEEGNEVFGEGSMATSFSEGEN